MYKLVNFSFRVGCLSCDFEICRDELQNILSGINTWNLHSIEQQAPDADVVIPEHEVHNFQMVDCPSCGGILKPKVVFFGDNVASSLKDFLLHKLRCCDAMLVMGSSLQVYSSFRFINAAKETGVPIAILNIGPTRGDAYAQLKLNYKASDVLTRASFYWNETVK